MYRCNECTQTDRSHLGFEHPDCQIVVPVHLEKEKVRATQFLGCQAAVESLARTSLSFRNTECAHLAKAAANGSFREVKCGLCNGGEIIQGLHD